MSTARSRHLRHQVGPPLLFRPSVTPVQAAAGLQRQRTSGTATVQFLPLHHPPGTKAVSVSAAACNAHKMAMDLLERCKAVAIEVPAGSADRFQRVELALNVERAVSILKKQISKAPVSSEVVLWVESSVANRKAHPNFLSRPHGMGSQLEEGSGFTIDSDFTVRNAMLVTFGLP